MSWIALHGPIGSGKTTLAKALEETHLRVNFTDILKENACLALYPYRPTTVGDISRNKEAFRPFLQAFGDIIGFTDEPKYVHQALRDWVALGRPDCVFDNVRSVAQASVLRAMGFLVVALQVPTDLLIKRTNASEESRSHRIEAPLPGDVIDVRLDATLPTASLVRQVRAI